MLFALMLLAAQDGGSAVDAERKMARAAQAEGQWTAVRRFAAPDAIVLAPAPTPVADAYDRRDPPAAYRWSPAASYVACDGSAAVNTGPWTLGRRVGYFTTVWRRQSGGGWKWVLDSGDALAAPRARPVKPRVRTASCAFQRSANPHFATMAEPARPGHGKSDDGTLMWDWQAEAGGRYSLTVWLWNGRSLDKVVHDVLPTGEGD
ncbi:MAG: hypothetical protein V4574_18360 [Pseudomonadota bacterium]